MVGGILCGITCLIGSVLSKSKDDWIAEARQEDAWMKYAQQDAKEDPWARGPEAPVPTPPTSSAHDQAGRTWK